MPARRSILLLILAVANLASGQDYFQPDGIDAIETLPAAPQLGHEPLIVPYDVPPAPPPQWTSPAAPNDDFRYYWGATARTYFRNDHRFEFTGQETTFGVEGVLNGGAIHTAGDWEVELGTELFINQPFDRNILVDSPMRQSFSANFDIEPLQISQLAISARRNDFLLKAGRFVTPFGRFYYPIFQNDFGDSPFIREQAIRYRETGLLAQWDPNWLVLTAALTNGGPERDTNSSKALIARAGVDFDWFAAGMSVKDQDGVGSEGQKTFNNHWGVDAMVRFGKWSLSGEMIYDEYGIRRPGFNPNDIFWGRSIYWRDLNNGYHQPITGTGYYLNLQYDGERSTVLFNYGDFYPEELGDPRHDTPIHRGMIKAAYHITPHWDVYTTVIMENDVPLGFGQKVRHGNQLGVGTQLVF